MSTEDKYCRRSSMTFTTKAHARLKAMCDQFSLTQPELINAFLENVKPEALRPIAEKLAGEKREAQEKKRQVREKMNAMSMEEMERLLKLAGQL